LTRKDAEAAMEAMNGKVIPKAGAVKGKGKEREGEGRPIAVDWALSKDQWEKAQQDGQEVKKEDDAESSSSGSSSSSSSGDSDSDSEEDSEDSSDEGADEDAEMDDEEEEEEEPTKPKLPTVDVGSTLFVRNLSFDATEQELMSL
jgi:nucleolar protein 4